MWFYNSLKSKFFLSLFCLVICSRQLFAFTVEKSPKIVVVGSGPSGIACATALINYGFKDVTVLEAEPRIGGRIHTIPYADNVIDMGAQWCHGETGNVVYELASKAGLLEHANEAIDNLTYVRSSMEVLPAKLADRLMNITDYIKELRDEEINDYEGSMGQFMREKFDEAFALPENADIDKKIAREFYAAFEKEQSGDEGSDSLDVISSRNYMLFEDVKGDYEQIWKDKGYKEFLRLLMKTNETGSEYGILEGRMKLSKKVESISWQRDDRKALVRCKDGEEIVADHVVVTVSLGVLKERLEDMFEPKLPEEKQKAIKAMGYGSFDKIFLEFPQRFWTENWAGLYFLWRDEDLKEIRGTPMAWLESVYGFNTIPYQPRLLEGWIVGESARLMESMNEDDIKKGAMWLLRRFLPIEIPEPINVTISRWYTNPNFRGCYSHHTLETERSGVVNQHLANALKAICDLDNYVDECEKPVLQFAGEATNDKHYATVHGAVESGFREAQRIKEYYEYFPQTKKEE